MTTSNAPVQSEQLLSAAQKTAIASQLERLLSSTWFRTSRRCSTLLRHTVEAAIAGRGDQLRERQIGIHAYHRPAGYDTDDDPIVRIAAGDVRKRLAQYYSDPETAGQIQIGLPIGSYAPIFHFPGHEEPAAPLSYMQSSVAPSKAHAKIADAALAGSSESPTAQALQPQRSHRWRYSAIAVCVFLLIGLGLYLSLAVVRREDRAREFWAPFQASSGPTLICMNDLASFKKEFPWFTFSQGALDGSAGAYLRTQDQIYFPDALNSTKLAVKISSAGGTYRQTTSNMTSLTDLRQGPVILLGGFGNDWTMRVMESLRYGFEMRPNVGGVVTDKQNPGQVKWAVSYAVPLEKYSEEYGIIARLRSSITEKPMMVIAGLSEPGTIAAEEIVTNPQYLEVLLKSAPAGWEKKNMEAVIETQVIEGKSGPPKVLATQFW